MAMKASLLRAALWLLAAPGRAERAWKRAVRRVEIRLSVALCEATNGEEGFPF